jgi:hypothetical protein
MLIQSLIWFEWLTGWELWRHGDDACTPPRFSRWYFNFSTTNNTYYLLWTPPRFSLVVFKKIYCTLVQNC